MGLGYIPSMISISPLFGQPPPTVQLHWLINNNLFDYGKGRRAGLNLQSRPRSARPARHVLDIEDEEALCIEGLALEADALATAGARAGLIGGVEGDFGFMVDTDVDLGAVGAHVLFRLGGLLVDVFDEAVGRVGALDGGEKEVSWVNDLFLGFWLLVRWLSLESSWPQRGDLKTWLMRECCIGVLGVLTVK